MKILIEKENCMNNFSSIFESTLTISDLIEIGLSVETEIVRVISLSSTEISEITRLKKTDLQGPDTLNS